MSVQHRTKPYAPGISNSCIIIMIFSLLIRLHLSMKKLAESRLQDGTGRKPNYRLIIISFDSELLL